MFHATREYKPPPPASVPKPKTSKRTSVVSSQLRGPALPKALAASWPPDADGIADSPATSIAASPAGGGSAGPASTCAAKGGRRCLMM